MSDRGTLEGFCIALNCEYGPERIDELSRFVGIQPALTSIDTYALWLFIKKMIEKAEDA